MRPLRFFAPPLSLPFALALSSLALAVPPASAQSPARNPRPSHANFASHPYMGWSSWSRFRGHPTEAILKAQADALIANHLLPLGYRYINVDDGWTDGFDAHGIPKPNLTRFPDGMDGMARYLHAHGLLFGIYLNPGITPALYKQNPQIEGTSSHIDDIADTGLPGSTHRGSYRIDFAKPAARLYIQSQVRQFDRWGVDFIKMDFVGPGGGNLPADNREEMRQWHAALAHASHPIWLELSNYLSIDQAPLWRATANGWRIENDIECYGCNRDPNPALHGNLTQWSKVVTRFTDVVPWIPYAGPNSPAAGGWSDLDSLELGNGDKDGITPDERQSMFVLWSISCAPLFLGSDLTHMDPADLTLLSNPDIIAIDQRGIPARPLDIQHLRNKPQQAWLTTYPNGSAILALFNLADTPSEITLSWREIDALRNTHFTARIASSHPPTLEDLIAHTTTPADPAGLTVSLAPHASRIFRIPAHH